MSAEFARCPSCATILEIPGGFWQKVWPFGHSEVACRGCHRNVPVELARVMGESYAHYARQLHDGVEHAAAELPILGNAVALQAMQAGSDFTQVRPMPSMEALTHHVAQVYRAVLTDQAHGRDVRIEHAVIAAANGTRILAVVGHTSPDGTNKETELLVARVGRHQFLVFQPDVALPRIREAIFTARHAPA